jgi:hypothetical protein
MASALSRELRENCAHRSRVEIHSRLGHGERRRARGQMQKLSAEKFHGVPQIREGRSSACFVGGSQTKIYELPDSVEGGQCLFLALCDVVSLRERVGSQRNSGHGADLITRGEPRGPTGGPYPGSCPGQPAVLHQDWSGHEGSPPDLPGPQFVQEPSLAPVRPRLQLLGDVAEVPGRFLC